MNRHNRSFICVHLSFGQANRPVSFWVVQKDLFHSLEIAITIQVIRLEITGFGPLVPAVDGHQRLLIRVGIQVVFGHLQGFAHIVRCVVLDDTGPEGRETRIVVPAQRDMRKVGYRIVPIDPIPLLLDIGQDLQVVTVDVGEMKKLLMADTVKGQKFGQFAAGTPARRVDAAQVDDKLAPKGHLQVQTWKSGCLDLFSEVVQAGFCSLEAAQAADQIFQVVDHEDRFALDAVISLLAEIALNQPLG